VGVELPLGLRFLLCLYPMFPCSHVLPVVEEGFVVHILYQQRVRVHFVVKASYLGLGRLGCSAGFQLIVCFVIPDWL
jgi:hypothetical protein